ncbi:hypothetical protein [Ruegeria arenilitoris]|uniref:hypothetical protein n=1 Tax=Ruegeria arenilitoris TaxID=1173585 RepID=UPI00147C5DD5|nr:hypothetical protein [Ruegeria arenilitoris]
MTDQEKIRAYESQITAAVNLVDALQIVAWDFASTQIEDQNLNQIRNAVVGLSDSLENVLAKDV